jgi:hypothetical protein
MEDYINKYEQFESSIIYDFRLGDGGIGDCIKFFIFILELCIKNDIRLYYKKNNIIIEKYIKLIHDKMYINEESIVKLDNFIIKKPNEYYSKFNYNFNLKIEDVFFFTDEVKINYNNLLEFNITNYISIHLRVGDKFLETDENFIICKNDTRDFLEENLYKFIEDNHNKKIFFCCDNNNYKLKIKERYKNITITNCVIGHTSLLNTTQKQVLDSITEFYILTNSNLIYCASYSGFSIIASKFKNIPLIYDKDYNNFFPSGFDKDRLIC